MAGRKRNKPAYTSDASGSDDEIDYEARYYTKKEIIQEKNW